MGNRVARDGRVVGDSITSGVKRKGRVRGKHVDTNSSRVGEET